MSPESTASGIAFDLEKRLKLNEEILPDSVAVIGHTLAFFQDERDRDSVQSLEWQLEAELRLVRAGAEVDPDLLSSYFNVPLDAYLAETEKQLSDVRELHAAYKTLLETGSPEEVSAFARARIEVGELAALRQLRSAQSPVK